MRVSRGISVAGKMFDGGQHAAFMRAFDIGCDQIAHLLRIFPERARVDNGINWVRVNVGVRKKIPVNADGTRFFRGDAAESLRIFRLAIPAECHGMGEGGGSHQPNRDAAFKIGGKQQRKFGLALQAVEKLGSLVRFAAQQIWSVHMHRHGERAHVILLHGFAQLQVLRIFHVEKAGAAPDHEHLADLLFRRQLA